MKKRNIAIYLSILGVGLALSACGTKEHIVETPQQVTMVENESEHIAEDNIESDDDTEIHIPSKEEVLAMRENVLEGMSEEEIDRLTENIKVANLRLESAYLKDNIFEKLSDKDSLYWNYFEQKGDIQIGWSYDGSNSDMKEIMEKESISQNEFYEKYGEPVMVYNRFDATNFINLIQDMQESVHNEMLIADFQQLIDLTVLAEETHKMEYANEIYKILHDLDYFLLRYGIEDVGKYTDDESVVATYYGVLAVYGATPFEMENAENLESVEESIVLDMDYQSIEDEVYRNLVQKMLETGAFPATEGIQCDGMLYDNQYSVMDIDDDGKEELLIDFANADSMGGMALFIYDYDRETEEVYIEYAGWPGMTVYDNGYIKEEASHNHGKSNLDDFWPYSLLKYNDQADKYECIAKIDAWQYQIFEDIDSEFPKEKDLDGDGIVYYDAFEGYYEPTLIMDNAEYAAWCEQYSEGSTKEIIWYSIISEEKYYEMFSSQAVE